VEGTVVVMCWRLAIRRLGPGDLGRWLAGCWGEGLDEDGDEHESWR